MINTALAVLLTSSLLSYFIYSFLVPSWNLREYAELKNDWFSIFAWSTGISTVSATFLAYRSENIVMSVILGVFFYFTLIAAQTDYRLHLVPRELSSLTIWFSFILGATAFLLGERTIMFSFENDPTQTTIISFFLYMGVMVLIFLLWLFGIELMGFGDWKLFIAAGFASSWYLGYVNMIAIFIVMNVLMFIQLITKKISKKGGKSIPALPAFSVAVILVSLLVV